jgi:hypothetical protein
MSSLRRSTRSAIAPPQGPSRSDGRPPAARTRPSEAAEPVSCSTSQPIAVCCKNVPLAETTCPAKNLRKGVDSRARKDPLRKPLAGVDACGAASGIAASASRSTSTLAVKDHL